MRPRARTAAPLAVELPTACGGEDEGPPPPPLEGDAAIPPGTSFHAHDPGGGPGHGCLGLDQDGVRDDAADDADSHCENEQMKGVVETLGCGDRLHYTSAPGASHHEAAWRVRSPAVLAILEAL